MVAIIERTIYYFERPIIFKCNHTKVKLVKTTQFCIYADDNKMAANLRTEMYLLWKKLLRKTILQIYKTNSHMFVCK